MDLAGILRFGKALPKTLVTTQIPVAKSSKISSTTGRLHTLKHTKRGQTFFGMSRYVNYPGPPGGRRVCAERCKEFRGDSNLDEKSGI